MKKYLRGVVSILALGVAFGLGIPGAAHAALACSPGSNNTVGAFTCVESVTFGPTLMSPHPSGPFATLTLDKWVSTASPGFTQTLQDVKYFESGTVHSSVEINNDSQGNQSFDFSQTEALSFTAGAGSPASFLPSVVTLNGTFGPQLVAFIPSDISAFFKFVDFALGPTAPVVDTTGLAEFIGPGIFQALVSLETNDLTGGNSFSISDFTVSVNMNITYDFTTDLAQPPTNVPEPATILLLGAALLGLRAIRRRRA